MAPSGSFQCKTALERTALERTDVILFIGTRCSRFDRFKCSIYGGMVQKILLHFMCLSSRFQVVFIDTLNTQALSTSQRLFKPSR